MHPWNIIYEGDRAFVNKNNGYALCIGSSEEARKANPRKLAEMVYEAMIWEEAWKYQGFPQTEH